MTLSVSKGDSQTLDSSNNVQNKTLDEPKDCEDSKPKQKIKGTHFLFCLPSYGNPPPKKRNGEKRRVARRKARLERRSLPTSGFGSRGPRNQMAAPRGDRWSGKKGEVSLVILKQNSNNSTNTNKKKKKEKKTRRRKKRRLRTMAKTLCGRFITQLAHHVPTAQPAEERLGLVIGGVAGLDHADASELQMCGRHASASAFKLSDGAIARVTQVVCGPMCLKMFNRGKPQVLVSMLLLTRASHFGYCS